jgi:hypothetical protein
VPAESAVVAPASYTSIALNVTASSYGKLAALKASSPSAFHLGRETASTFSLVSVNANGELLEYDMLKRRGMQPFAENVVLIKARYGVDSGVGGKANDNVIDEWISPQRPAGHLAELMDGKVPPSRRSTRSRRSASVCAAPGQAVSSDAKLTQLVLFSDLRHAKGDPRPHDRRAALWLPGIRLGHPPAQHEVHSEIISRCCHAVQCSPLSFLSSSRSRGTVLAVVLVVLVVMMLGGVSMLAPSIRQHCCPAIWPSSVTRSTTRRWASMRLSRS